MSSDSGSVDPAAQFLQSARSSSLLRSSFSPDPVSARQLGQTNSEDASDDGETEFGSAGSEAAQILAHQNMAAFGRAVKRTKHMSAKSASDFESFMKASLCFVISCHIVDAPFLGK